VASSIDRVKQSIRERLDELEAERDQLLKALEALSGSSASVGGRRGRPPGSGSGSGRSSGRADKRAAGRRAPRGRRREQVIATLQGGEKGPSEIAREIGDVNPTQISGLLRQLASQGVVARTEGGKWRLADAGGANGQPTAAAAEPAETAPTSPSEPSFPG
jgi:DNA-binding transcriptional ArsR family regulator